ncbi:cobalamin biosynthesis protein [Leptospira inadai serovar Lyme str. 10]|uniref:Cobalamin biosynthesis protein n=2 Tax=Leptospira inadai serovar Lyme TaxID=293084 RepID=V6H8K6_9LEPT|nr:cobalamin biosynthesis protein [Leptospira inadai]EQA35271.1 cobalamin biosynthesis protein [Leptospira inadai serovar Lyme str. 10]PNV71935.1 cobalamin biosynthesis protein [Leptospira inadai serovar Lyme]
MNPIRKPYAIYAITKHGIVIGERLRKSLGTADLFVSKKLSDQAPADSLSLSLPMDSTLRETFTQYDCHIFIISVGAVVRMIAPLLQNKKVDPAVICVDDKGLFSICVLSGHVGRGNVFTQIVSKALENTPVITTASDVAGTLTVDILGRDLGWVLEDQDRNVTRACAAVVNETKVLFVQECGESDWWPKDKPLPPGVEYSTSLEAADPEKYEILLIATDRSNIKQTHPKHYNNSVIYRPKSLILGLGCDRDISFEDVRSGIMTTLDENNLSLESVRAIASIDRKHDERAFLELAQAFQWEFLTFPASELDRVTGIVSPSAMAMKHVETRSVSEAAALLGAGTDFLIVPKRKYKRTPESKNLTVAIARIPFLPREEVLIAKEAIRS